jgi:hypothetical protein
MQQGKMFVISANSITIPLDGFPGEVRVDFSDKQPEPIPCNPNDEDSLQFAVHASSTVASGFVLIISWSVSGVREIKWEVDY